MNELMIKTPAIIECDFDGIEKYLDEQLAVYRGMVFTEDSKADAKKTVAELRKQKKAFSDRVKEVKEEYMKPFNDFFQRASQIIAKYDEPVMFINGQIDAFEQKRVEEKKTRIQEIYEEFIGDMMEELPLSRIYNPKWENATYTEKQIKDDIYQAKEKVKTGISTIKAMGSDIEDRVIGQFLLDYDIQKAVLAITQHEKDKAEILAREQEILRAEEEERIRKEEREKLEAELRHQEETQKAVEQAKAEAEQEVIDSFIPEQGGASEIYEYHITLTEAEKEKLEMYMDSIGIDYEIMPRFV